MNASLQSFLVLCQFLAVNQGPETIERIRHEIKIDAVDWESIVKIANQQLVSPALWVSLMNKGLDEDLPDELKCYLSGLHNLNLQRNILIKQQAEEIIRSLNEIGIEPILLKGAALLFTNAFTDSGTRILADLDIMVLEADVEKSWKILSALGYRTHEPDAPVDTWAHHQPPMLRDGEPAATELHTQLFSRYDGKMVLTAADCFEEAVTIKTKSLCFKILSPTHFIIHNIVHSEVHHRHFYSGIISLRMLLDLAVMSDVQPNAIDWKSIDDKMEEYGIRHIYRSYIHVAATLLDVSVPGDSGPTIVSKLHLKRCLLIYGSGHLHALVWKWTDRVRLCQIVGQNLTAERLKIRFGCSNGIVDLNKTRLKYLWFLFRKYALNIR